MTDPAPPAECEACGHEWDRVLPLRPIGLTHDVTSDGKLWCSVCEGECPLIARLIRERDEARKVLEHAIDVGLFYRTPIEADARRALEGREG